MIGFDQKMKSGNFRICETFGEMVSIGKSLISRYIREYNTRRFKGEIRETV